MPGKSNHTVRHRDVGGSDEMLSRWGKRTYVPKWAVQKGFQKSVMGQDLIRE